MAPNLLMAQVDVDAQPDLWKFFRRQGITASEIASVLGIAPESYEDASPFALFTAKKHGDGFKGDTDAMARGRHLEPYVSDLYHEENGHLNLFPGGLYSSGERSWQMATFDRLAVNPARFGTISVPELTRLMWPHAFPVQIKTAVSRYDNRGREIWGEDGSDQIPDHYRAQCLYELDVWDTDVIHVPCLFMNDWQLRIYVINRDKEADADIIYMREAAEEFLDRLRADDPPPVDWTPATTRALKTLHPGEPHGSVIIPVKMAERYKAAKTARDKVNRRLAQVTNEILSYSGDAREITTLVKGNQVKVASRSKGTQRRTDSKVLRKRYPNIAKEVETETPFTRLTPSSWASPARERKIRG